MHGCSDKCDSNPLVLCSHRFNFKTQIKYYNTNQFRGWPDSKILLHVLDYAKANIDNGLLAKDVFFVLLTKDCDFLKDAESELGRSVRGNELEFSNNFVIWGDIVIFVQLLDCKSYGTRRPDDLRCAIYKMNKFFTKQTKA